MRFLGIFLYHRGWSFYRASFGRLGDIELSVGKDWSSRLFVNLSLGDDTTESHNAQVAFGVPWLFALYISFTIPFLARHFVHRVTGKKIKPPYPEGWDHTEYDLRGPLYGGAWPREWGLGVDLSTEHIGGPSLHWSIGTTKHQWSRGDWSGSWQPLDTILGRHVYTSDVFYAADDKVVMPEGAYPCTVEISLDRWKRPRWPRPLTLVRYSVHMAEGHGVPFPGKGENSWDCGTDRRHAQSGAIEGMTIEAALAAPHEAAILAIEQVRQSVTKSRNR